ncbi:GNAT family N-acetyltransferase [Rubripirellula sp.]|nr:GNAT family N-acetyltransferase [Rubripirellula sp.]
MLQKRIQKALKQEAGLRLSAAEVQGLAYALNIDFPKPTERQRREAWRQIAPPPPRPAGGIGDVRWMIRRDMPEVLQMEQAAGGAWNEDDFIAKLRQRNSIGMVVEIPTGGRDPEPAVGFMVYTLHLKHLYLDRLVVDAKVRRRGLGRQMVGKLVGKLSADRRRQIDVDVPESDVATQQFFRSVGFEAIGLGDGKISMVHRVFDDVMKF